MPLAFTCYNILSAHNKRKPFQLPILWKKYLKKYISVNIKSFTIDQFVMKHFRKSLSVHNEKKPCNLSFCEKKTFEEKRYIPFITNKLYNCSICYEISKETDAILCCVLHNEKPFDHPYCEKIFEEINCIYHFNFKMR